MKSLVEQIYMMSIFYEEEIRLLNKDVLYPFNNAKLEVMSEHIEITLDDFLRVRINFEIINTIIYNPEWPVGKIRKDYIIDDAYIGYAEEGITLRVEGLEEKDIHNFIKKLLETIISSAKETISLKEIKVIELIRVFMKEKQQ